MGNVETTRASKSARLTSTGWSMPARSTSTCARRRGSESAQRTRVATGCLAVPGFSDVRMPLAALFD
ncbi:MAG: hypothetical protein DI536_32590 [Archangium gephyra]|uniref:Uncharacterized protein n=1 Tax=Archangium gephyra TaxID=48 RepID=A0A2W5T051_9BACT|nr:MAG: hypothetical protein DI536_32590 [Archangium gephyra]